MENSTGELLLSFAQRIGRLEDEIKDLNADKSDVYKEAKGLGLDVKALRAVIARRRKVSDNPDAVAEHEALVDLYESAISEAEARAAVPHRARTHESQGVAA